MLRNNRTTVLRSNVYLDRNFLTDGSDDLTFDMRVEDLFKMSDDPIRWFFDNKAPEDTSHYNYHLSIQLLC